MMFAHNIISGQNPYNNLYIKFTDIGINLKIENKNVGSDTTFFRLKDSAGRYSVHFYTLNDYKPHIGISDDGSTLMIEYSGHAPQNHSIVFERVLNNSIGRMLIDIGQLKFYDNQLSVMFQANMRLTFELNLEKTINDND